MRHDADEQHAHKNATQEPVALESQPIDASVHNEEVHDLNEKGADSGGPAENKNAGGTGRAGSFKPYDVAWRTFAEYMPQLIIPFINRVFGTNYSQNAIVQLLPTQITPKNANGQRSERAMDGHFSVVEPDGSGYGEYHVEIESGDGRDMDERLWEYDLPIAAVSRGDNDEPLEVVLPQTVVLFLRSRKNRDKWIRARVVLRDKDFQELPVIHHFAATQVADYAFCEILDEELYVLLLFYIFQVEAQLKAIHADPAKLDALAKLYQRISEYIDEAHANDKISAENTIRLRELITSVVKEVARDYENIRNEVNNVINTPLLPSVIDEVVREAEARGEGRGEARGEAIGEVRGEARGIILGRIAQYIETSREYAANDACIVAGLQAKFGLSEPEAVQTLGKYGPNGAS